MTASSDIYKKFPKQMPTAIIDWETKVDKWCAEYKQRSGDSQLTEIVLDQTVFIFDLIEERVVIAYAISSEQLNKRDSSRIRGFPNVNASTQSEARKNKGFVSDKGHFLGHASGGELDINLFPQRRELNRGWSEEGKRFRKMEKFAADNLGTFFYHRALYSDNTWVPSFLEYGVLIKDETWWIDMFENAGE